MFDPGELRVFEAAGRTGFAGMGPEGADRYGEMRRFAEEQWSRRASG